MSEGVYLNIPACMTVFNQLGELSLCGFLGEGLGNELSLGEGLGNLSKREIFSLFFLTTEFLSFNIQDNNKQDFRRKEA